jgi:hypothetical protein
MVLEISGSAETEPFWRDYVVHGGADLDKPG